MQGKYIFTHKDRLLTVYGMLRKYSVNKREVDEFDQNTNELKAREPAVCRPNRISDPTARTAVKRADAPGGLQYKRDWIAAINDARAECKVIDEREDYGYALEFVLVNAYALDGQEPMPRQQILRECHFSVSTYYSRMELITDIVMHHAGVRGLL